MAKGRAERKRVGKVVFATLFISAGIGHFVRTDFYERIMPPYIPWHRPMVLASGVIEVVLGILLPVPRFSRLAAWGLIALLLAVFPANIHIYLHQRMFPLHPALHLCAVAVAGLVNSVGVYIYKAIRGRSRLREEVDSTGDGR